MKKITALLIYTFFAALSMRADVLFSDNLNYPDGCIETDGLWYAYSPTSPHQDAFVTNDLLILNQANYDSVAAPTNNFISGDPVYASFTINVSTLPTFKGGYICSFKGSTNVFIVNIFVATTNTTVPGTYQLGIANAASSVTAPGVSLFPLDLATGITYQVVFSYDEGNTLAQLWVNPASSSDTSVEASDDVTNSDELNINISQIAFSQYFNQGVEAIGNILVGDSFGDVATNAPQVPVIGIEPQDTNFYSGNNLTLYVAASGTGQLTYQWLSNSIPFSDDGGVTVSGSQSNIVVLNNLQTTAGYSVIIANSAGSVTSRVATVSIDSTPTPPFFTLQPQGETNSVLASVTLTAAADGTGPITYQWNFEPAGGSSFYALSGQTNSTLSFSADYVNSGSYYVTATGGQGVGSTNSATVSVLVIPPPLVSISYMHSFITNDTHTDTINGGQIFDVQGVVTSIGQIQSKTSSEFFIQDGTGGCLVYAGGFNITNTPPVGALVNVVSPAESYEGQIEMDPTTTAPTNAVIILSTNNPLPAPIPLNIAAMSTNDSIQGSYGEINQCALATLTNVYIYASAAGAAISGNFPTNSSKALYAFQQPYSAGLPYIEVYVYTYTNAANLINTNYFGKPIKNFYYEITGANGVYNPTEPNFYPTRYQDFVSTLPASFSANLTMTNGVPTVTWPAVVGSTYSVYSAANITGPWTQTFGLSYYPSTGIYTDTNAAATQFYKVSSP